VSYEVFIKIFSVYLSQSNFQIVVFSCTQVNEESAMLGLARVGSRAILSFAFAFLRRAWRSGEDSDLCSELLQESLEALRSLPEATLFTGDGNSGVWLEVVERSSKFLRSVIEGLVVLIFQIDCILILFFCILIFL